MKTRRRREVLPAAATLEAAAETLAHRALEFVGFKPQEGDDLVECDVAIRDLALRVYRMLGKEPPNRPYKKTYE